MSPGLLSADDARRVADAFRAHGYTVDGVGGLMGDVAERALGRGEPVAALRAVADDRSPLATLTRLFLLGEPVAEADAAAALPLDAAGPLLERAGGALRAAYDIAPHEDEWWVVSDLVDRSGRPRRRPDHVLGVGAASTTLASLTVRRPVARALDVGTGCGVQALHLSTHASAVTATDAVPRAVDLAATTFALSDVSVELATGDLFEPVASRDFDLVVCNPPFVIGPSARYAYRDAGREGDALGREVLAGAAGVLAAGGIAQVLANWLHVRGEDWRDRVGGWLTTLGCDAWVLQRDVQDPAEYVALWLDDAGEAGDDVRAEAWLAWLAERHVEAVGFGWVTLRRGDAPHHIVMEEALQPVDSPLGPAVASWLDRQDWLRTRVDDDLLAHAFTAAPDLRLDTTSTRGGNGWSPVALGLRLESGFRWAAEVDEHIAALAAGCDGTHALHELVSVLAAVSAAAYDDVAADIAPVVRALVQRGLLVV